jgi:hypothetical protein
MKSFKFIVTAMFISPAAWGGNSYIEFEQFEKVQRVSAAAGALYACSKNEKIDIEKQKAYQFMHFKLDQVVTDYFKLAYRVVAVQDIPLEKRVTIVDNHRKIEEQVQPLQKAAYDSVLKGEMKCEDARTFASEVMSFNE